MNKSSIIITVAIAAVTISLWAAFNQPEREPAWPSTIQGFSFSPMRLDDDPIIKKYPTIEEIDADLALLAGKTHAVRTYTVEDVLGEVPALAKKHHLNVSLGAWIEGDDKKNQIEIAHLLKVAGENQSNVVRITVGNEALLRGDLPVHQLIGYIERVRAAVGVPVSTAEPWHVWTKHPELAKRVDYLAVHMLPYWEGVDVDLAVDYVVERYNELHQMYPDKPIVISEVGWPSHGRTRHAAVASVANEATFLRRFLDRAKQEKYTYYVMEAFDQPWKRQTEGAVGAYWGVYDVNRQPKFPFSEPIVEIPQWHILAAISVFLAAVTLAAVLRGSRTLASRGRGFLAVIVYAAATAVVWIVYNYVNQYLTIGTIIVGVLLVIGMVGVIVVLLAEAHEWAEALWVTHRRRKFKPVPVADEDLPMVSIHVPTYNEPPDMVIETLNALARLDYPRYEVLIIDNNTKDPAVWQPVEAHCRTLGPRFRFFHEDPLSGFKSGALNYTLARTAPEASIIAVIDSDYIVTPNWLRDLTPQFTNPNMAIVQAPQDYRDIEVNAFKAMCYVEYRGFFYIGMVTRNDRNAIIQHGTMTMIRKSVLEEVGAWSEWCITEDAELGLRVFEKGYEATYIAKSYGKGLVPDTFIDFKKQRFRWAYGAVQILKRHAGALLGTTPTKLSFGQRYHFFAGWLPWLADGFNVLFNIAAMAWSTAMVFWPKLVDPPLVVFAILPLALFCFKLGKLIYLYRAQVGTTVLQTFAAALAGLALSHTIALAILQGFVTSGKPYFRTPKMAHAHALRKALASTREEFLVMLALWTCAGGVAIAQGTATLDLVLWIVMLLIQSIPYFAALLVAVISGFPRLPAGPLGRVPHDQSGIAAPPLSVTQPGS